MVHVLSSIYPMCWRWAASNTTMTDEIKMDVRERGLDRYRGNHEDLDGLIIKDASIMVMMIHGR